MSAVRSYCVRTEVNNDEPDPATSDIIKVEYGIDNWIELPIVSDDNVVVESEPGLEIPPETFNSFEIKDEPVSIKIEPIENHWATDCKLGKKTQLSVQLVRLTSEEIFRLRANSRNRPKTSGKTSKEKHSAWEDEEEEHSCTICQKTYKGLRRLKDHNYLVHRNDYIFQCSQCNMKFRHNSYLNRHMRTHSGVTFPCPSCEKVYKTKYRLEEHSRLHNSKEARRTCKICSKDFADKANLIEHMRMHSGERPYKCTFCGKGFARRFTRTNHMRTHTKEKPYSCPHCDYACAKKCALDEHVTIHGKEMPHSCEFCGKQWRTKAMLAQHLKSHSTDKPFSCETCGKSFVRKSELTQHVKVHAKVAVSEIQKTNESDNDHKESIEWPDYICDENIKSEQILGL